MNQNDYGSIIVFVYLYTKLFKLIANMESKASSNGVKPDYPLRNCKQEETPRQDRVSNQNDNPTTPSPRGHA